jgi:exportin-T
MVMLLSQDVNDPQSEKFAFQFLARCISIWARPTDAANGLDASESIPGFERFVYEHLIPLAFKVPSMPEFNIKDGQMVTVSFRIVTSSPVHVVLTPAPRYATKSRG